MIQNIYYNDLTNYIEYLLQNWDDDLHKIMERKMKLCEEQMNNRNIHNNHVAKDVSQPIVLTDSNFSESVGKYPLLVVDFWAPWCGPCRMVSPVIEELASELSGKVVFGKLNVDENPSVSGAFGIQSIPTIMIFKEGQVVDGFLGAVTKPQIMLKVSQYM